MYWLYQKGILTNKIQVASIDETIDVMLNTEKSLIRFGDGEIALITGGKSITQANDKILARELSEILQFKEDDLLITIPEIFDGLDEHHSKSKKFWIMHLATTRQVYNRLCNKEKKYYSTFMTRGYYLFKDKSKAANQYQKIRNIWKGRDIVVIEGMTAHNGVENDLFEHAKSVKRILCPSQNAFEVYDEILEESKKSNKESLILIALGATAKILAKDLFHAGYRVIDIGNLDMEYEWFLKQAQGKMKLKKHEIVGKQQNLDAGYDDYVAEVNYVVSERW